MLQEELPSGSGGPAGLRQRGTSSGGLQHPEEPVLEGRHQQQESPPRHRLRVSADDLRPAGHKGDVKQTLSALRGSRAGNRKQLVFRLQYVAGWMF